MLLWSGQALSTLGSQTSSLAYPLLVLALTHSPAKAGLVGFCRVLPWVACMVPLSALVDRADRKRLLLAADAGRLLALASLVAALLAGRLGLAQILVVAFVEGTLYVLFNLAETGAIAAVVPPAQRPLAVAQNDARNFAAIVAGPPLGGFLFGVARVLPFVADMVSYVCSITAVLLLRVPLQETRAPQPRRLRAELAEGFRWLWAQRFLRDAAALFAVGNFINAGMFILLVVVARRQGWTAGEIGAGVAAIGVCGVAGAFASPWLQRRLAPRAVVAAMPCLTVAELGVFAAHPRAWLLVVFGLAGGALAPTLNAVTVGYRMALLPDRLQGRVNGVARLAAQVGAPLGPLAAGVALERWSAAQTSLAFGVVALAAAIFALASRGVREAPSRQELLTVEVGPEAA